MDLQREAPFRVGDDADRARGLALPLARGLACPLSREDRRIGKPDKGYGLVD